MKRLYRRLTGWLNRVYNYPFWLFLAGLYGAAALYALCALAVWRPGLIAPPERCLPLAAELFEAGTGLLAAGGVAAPLLDLICQFDLPH